MGIDYDKVGFCKKHSYPKERHDRRGWNDAKKSLKGERELERERETRVKGG